ncbi:MAG: group 1 truncated hemoglobin [Pseudohongiellaceae bacterium]
MTVRNRKKHWVGLRPLILVMALAGCGTTGQSDTLFQELGGHEGIDRIVDEFILEIANDPRVLPRFEDSNVQRFREMITEHFCMVAEGPCEYTGDSMVEIHAGMELSSPEFNAVVEDLIAAMEQSDIPLAAQNRLLARLARLRPEIIRI